MNKNITVKEHYELLASRTESHNFEGKQYSKELFIESLKLAIKSAQLLDIFKKNFFYNREYSNEKFQETIQDLKQTIEVIEKHNIEDNLNGKLKEEDKITFNKNDIDNIRLYHLILGVITEGGELGEALEQHLNGSDLDWINLVEENGDIDWYQAILYNILKERDININELDVRTKNINKLAKRYGEKFSDYNANNRDLETERKILES